jgi:hypothetical protein
VSSNLINVLAREQMLSASDVHLVTGPGNGSLLEALDALRLQQRSNPETLPRKALGRAFLRVLWRVARQIDSFDATQTPSELQVRWRASGEEILRTVHASLDLCRGQGPRVDLATLQGVKTALRGLLLRHPELHGARVLACRIDKLGKPAVQSQVV